VKNKLKTLKVPHTICIDYQNVAELYQVCDAVISHSHIEVFPLSMLESLACGVPYFASTNGVTEHFLEKIDSNFILKKDQTLRENNFIKKIASSKMRKKLLLFASKYTWESSAKLFIKNCLKLL
jgi:glycosyltransferase involved in cell wall biosynthesis